MKSTGFYGRKAASTDLSFIMRTHIIVSLLFGYSIGSSSITNRQFRNTHDLLLMASRILLASPLREDAKMALNQPNLMLMKQFMNSLQDSRDGAPNWITPSKSLPISFKSDVEILKSLDQNPYGVFSVTSLLSRFVEKHLPAKLARYFSKSFKVNGLNQRRIGAFLIGNQPILTEGDGHFSVSAVDNVAKYFRFQNKYYRAHALVVSLRAYRAVAFVTKDETSQQWCYYVGDATQPKIIGTWDQLQAFINANLLQNVFYLEYNHAPEEAIQFSLDPVRILPVLTSSKDRIIEAVGPWNPLPSFNRFNDILDVVKDSAKVCQDNLPSILKNVDWHSSSLKEMDEVYLEEGETQLGDQFNLVPTIPKTKYVIAAIRSLFYIYPIRQRLIQHAIDGGESKLCILLVKGLLRSLLLPPLEIPQEKWIDDFDEVAHEIHVYINTLVEDSQDFGDFFINLLHRLEVELTDGNKPTARTSEESGPAWIQEKHANILQTDILPFDKEQIGAVIDVEPVGESQQFNGIRVVQEAKVIQREEDKIIDLIVPKRTMALIYRTMFSNQVGHERTIPLNLLHPEAGRYFLNVMVAEVYSETELFNGNLVLITRIPGSHGDIDRWYVSHGLYSGAITFEEVMEKFAPNASLYIYTQKGLGMVMVNKNTILSPVLPFKLLEEEDQALWAMAAKKERLEFKEATAFLNKSSYGEAKAKQRARKPKRPTYRIVRQGPKGPNHVESLLGASSSQEDRLILPEKDPLIPPQFSPASPPALNAVMLNLFYLQPVRVSLFSSYKTLGPKSRAISQALLRMSLQPRHPIDVSWDVLPALQDVEAGKSAAAFFNLIAAEDGFTWSNVFLMKSYGQGKCRAIFERVIADIVEHSSDGIVRDEQFNDHLCNGTVQKPVIVIESTATSEGNQWHPRVLSIQGKGRYELNGFITGDNTALVRTHPVKNIWYRVWGDHIGIVSEDAVEQYLSVAVLHFFISSGSVSK